MELFMSKVRVRMKSFLPSLRIISIESNDLLNLSFEVIESLSKYFVEIFKIL